MGEGETQGVCIYVCSCVIKGALVDRRRASDSLELALQMIVSCPLRGT